MTIGMIVIAMMGAESATMIRTTDMSENRWLDLNAREDDKIALLRAENYRLKQENEALQDELEKVKGELQCLREALTILPAEE